MRRILYVSCGPLPRKAWRTGIHIKTISRYLRVVDSCGSPYVSLYARYVYARYVYARRILVEPGMFFVSIYTWLDPRGSSCTQGGSLQWITGIGLHHPSLASCVYISRAQLHLKLILTCAGWTTLYFIYSDRSFHFPGRCSSLSQ